MHIKTRIRKSKSGNLIFKSNIKYLINWVKTVVYAQRMYEMCGYDEDTLLERNWLLIYSWLS